MSGLVGIIEHLATAGGVELQLLGGQLTEDDTRLPFVTGQLTVAPPADLAILDPDAGARIELALRSRVGAVLNFASDLTAAYAGQPASALTAAWAGWSAGEISAQPGAHWAADDRDPTARQWSLAIIDSATLADGSIQLELESDDGPYSRVPWLGEGRELLAGLSPTLRGALANISPSEHLQLPAELLPGSFDAPVPVGLDGDTPDGRVVPIEPGQQVGQAFSSVFTATNSRLLAGSRPGVELVSADWGSEQEHTVQAGDVIEWDDSQQLDDEIAGDAVMVIYSEQKTAPGRPWVSISSNIIEGPAFRRPLVVEIDAPSPINSYGVDDRTAPANALLFRASRRLFAGRLIAAPGYTTTPRGRLVMQLPVGRRVGRVRSVTFDLEPPYSMTVIVQEILIQLEPA